MAELIITNGSSTEDRMRKAGFEEEILCWKDVLHDGPVPGNVSRQELAHIRSDFVARTFRLSEEEVRRDFDHRESIIRRLPEYSTVTLWFEHDLYDQLHLTEILHLLSDMENLPPVRLMQSDKHLGIIPPPEFPSLHQRARPITDRELSDGEVFWNTFTGDDPTLLNAFTEYTGPLTHLAANTQRLLQTFPYLESGLPLTQQHCLRHLLKEDLRPGTLFGQYVMDEPAAYLGDWSFFSYLEDMCYVPHPLISGFSETLHRSDKGYLTQTLRITEIGKDVLKGQANAITLNGIDRWIGGTHLTPDNVYCYHPDTERLVKVEGN